MANVYRDDEAMGLDTEPEEVKKLSQDVYIELDRQLWFLSQLLKDFYQGTNYEQGAKILHKRAKAFVESVEKFVELKK